MKNPTKSSTLMKHQTGKAMMDTSGRVSPPPAGDDFDSKKTIAGKTSPKTPDRDGPAKKMAGEGNPKKPGTSAKAGKMGAAKTTQAKPAKKSPDTGGQMPMGASMPIPSSPMGPMQAPPPNMINAMKASLGSNKKFSRAS